jgi:hypothetical protein
VIRLQLHVFSLNCRGFVAEVVADEMHRVMDRKLMGGRYED